MPLEAGRERRPLGNLGVRKDRVEPLLIQVVEDNPVAIGTELFGRRRGDSVTEAAGPLMPENQEDSHDFQSIGPRRKAEEGP